MVATGRTQLLRTQKEKEDLETEAHAARWMVVHEDTGPGGSPRCGRWQEGGDPKLLLSELSQVGTAG